MTGWWFQPLWKIMEFVSWDYYSNCIWKNKSHVPNHQPVFLVDKTLLENFRMHCLVRRSHQLVHYLPTLAHHIQNSGWVKQCLSSNVGTKCPDPVTQFESGQASQVIDSSLSRPRLEKFTFVPGQRKISQPANTSRLEASLYLRSWHRKMVTNAGDDASSTER